jgi:hypothetical protein
VAAVQAMEAILARAAVGEPDGIVRFERSGQMILQIPGKAASCILNDYGYSTSRRR